MGEQSRIEAFQDATRRHTSERPLAVILATALLSGGGVAGVATLLEALRAGDEAHIETLGVELERCETERQRCRERLDRCHGVPAAARMPTR